MNTISVFDLVGEYAITVEDGQKVYDIIKPELDAQNPLEIDFANVSIYASPFFNVGIGQLLRDFSSDDLNRLVNFAHLSALGKKTLQRVIENAKRYYSMTEEERRIVDFVLNESSESET